MVLPVSSLNRTCPQSAIKSPFSIASICATIRRIPASASTNQWHEKGDLIPL
jgi:hypothetical protein